MSVAQRILKGGRYPQIGSFCLEWCFLIGVNLVITFFITISWELKEGSCPSMLLVPVCAFFCLFLPGVRALSPWTFLLTEGGHHSMKAIFSCSKSDTVIWLYLDAGMQCLTICLGTLLSFPLSQFSHLEHYSWTKLFSSPGLWEERPSFQLKYPLLAGWKLLYR